MYHITQVPKLVTGENSCYNKNMYTKTFVNEVDGKWILSFGTPLMNYEGPEVEVSEGVARAILAIQNSV